MQNTINNRHRQDDTAALTGIICGVSDNYVRKVMRMERTNEVVVAVFMTIAEKKREAIEEATHIAHTLKGI